jgi:hypothetical protein
MAQSRVNGGYRLESGIRELCKPERISDNWCWLNAFI